MKKYRYKGRGRRVITDKDFASLGVEADTLDVSEGDVVELSDERAALLIGMREHFELIEGDGSTDAPTAAGDEEESTADVDDTVEDGPTGVPTVDDPGANVEGVEAPAGEEPGTSVDPGSPDVKASPSTSRAKKSGTGQVKDA